MVQKIYLDQLRASYFDYLFRIRKIKTGEPKLDRLLTTMEALIATGQITEPGVPRLITKLVRKKFGRMIEFVKVGDYVVFIPETDYLIHHLSRAPNIVTIYGNRGAGKTVLSLTLAWELAQKFPKSQVYFVNDIDGIGDPLLRYAPPEFADRLIIPDRFEVPPENPNITHIFVYNEIGWEQRAKKALLNEAVKLETLADRVRHHRNYLIHNIIRPHDFNKSIRMKSDVVILRSLFGTKLNEIEDDFPPPYRPIIRLAGYALDYGKALVYVEDPFRLHGVLFGLLRVEPPDWVLRASKAAKGRKDQNDWMKEAIELRLKGYGYVEIAKEMAKRGFKRSKSWWALKLKEVMENEAD